MMNPRKVIALLIAVLSVLAFTISAAGKPSDNIIIGNADTVRETPVSVEQGLLNSIAGAGARVVVEYANTLRHIELPVLASALQTRLDQVSARVVVEYANTVRHSNLVTMPTALQTLLGQVSDRIIFQYANTNRSLTLAYPAVLINDTTPPQISQIAARTVGDDTALITWTTDEFADSQVSYGVQSGQYTGTGSDPLYVKQHVITLTAMIPGTTYYYQVRSADQSNNTSTSSENSFKFQTVFDTLVVQKSVTPTGQVQYGKELTYTVVISAAQGASLGLYDALTDTTFVRFVMRPTGVVSTSHSVTGTFSIAAAQPVAVTFVVRVDVPLSAGTVDVTNQACVYVPPDSGTCKVSNQVTNQAFRPYRVFLPLVLKNR
jgi:hypothetical protein